MTEALFGWPPPVLDPAGPYASSVTILAWVLFALGAVVTLIVLAALYVALRGKPALKARFGGERLIWVAGIGFPIIVLTILLIWGLTLSARLAPPIKGDEMRIRVTGELFWFRVDYFDAAGRVAMSDANEIHIPAGRPVVFELASADVIHSFWVPHLSGKQDMIPGRTNRLRVEARKAGQYGGVCAEFCGRAHALMGFVVVAHDPASWRRWLATRQRIGAASGGRGERLFMESGCAACHRVGGTAANGLAGPDLTYVGSRRTLGAGILPNNKGTLRGWIADSQSIKPGNRMPNYDMLAAQDIAAIADWLETKR